MVGSPRRNGSERWQGSNELPLARPTQTNQNWKQYFQLIWTSSGHQHSLSHCEASSWQIYRQQPWIERVRFRGEGNEDLIRHRECQNLIPGNGWPWLSIRCASRVCLHQTVRANLHSLVHRSWLLSKGQNRSELFFLGAALLIQHLINLDW